MILLPCPSECDTQDLPYIQRSRRGHRVVCKCGVSARWSKNRVAALESWRGLPRQVEYSTERPTMAGPWWCKSPNGVEAIVDLTEADVAGLTLTLWSYVAFAPIRRPK